MITGILSLPTEILKQIPTGYRMWTLLQMTCSDMERRLGDYHDAREIYFTANERSTILYDEFVDNLTYVMLGASYQYKSYEMHKRTKVINNGHTSITCRVIADWHSGRFQVYSNNDHAFQNLKRYNDNYSNTKICIGGKWYERGNKAVPIEPLLAFIYNELPHLFSEIGVVRPMDTRDLGPFFCGPGPM